MESKNTLTLKEKIGKSRAIYLSISNERFLATLYELLEVLYQQTERELSNLIESRRSRYY